MAMSLPILVPGCTRGNVTGQGHGLFPPLVKYVVEKSACRLF